MKSKMVFLLLQLGALNISNVLSSEVDVKDDYGSIIHHARYTAINSQNENTKDYSVIKGRQRRKLGHGVQKERLGSNSVVDSDIPMVKGVMHSQIRGALTADNEKVNKTYRKERRDRKLGIQDEREQRGELKGNIRLD